MTPFGNDPGPVAMAKQRARAALTIGAVSFIAVGAIAWIGLDAVRGPTNSTVASSPTSRQGTTDAELFGLNGNQPVTSLQEDDQSVAHASGSPLSNSTSLTEREKAAARRAILQNAGTNLELLDLSEVEQLTSIADQRDPAVEAARLAILQNAGRNLELLDLSEVEELTGFARRTKQPASPRSNQVAATKQTEPNLDDSFEEIRVLAVEGGLQPGLVTDQSVEGSDTTLTASASTTSTGVASTGTDCIADLREFAASQTILFGSGSAELQGSELPTLRKIGRMAEACDGAFVQVTGHSDSSGTDIINLALSWQRADNTVATLAALGIDTTKFEPVGFGARAPSSQGDNTDEERNRRVEFVVFKTDGGIQ